MNVTINRVLPFLSKLKVASCFNVHCHLYNYLFSKFAILDRLGYLAVLKYPTPTKDSILNSENA